MTDPGAGIPRRVDRVHTKTRLGPDRQVDDKAMIIMPTDFARTDPFLGLSEDWFSTCGFEWHPHRGIETVTMVLDGVLEHGDNLGNTGALEPGDVQWMTAGRGIIHRELALRNEHAHTLQLWVNLPARQKMVPNRYQDLRAGDNARHSRPGVSVRVISGRIGTSAGPAANHWPILALVITLDPASAHTQPLPAHARAFAYLPSGSATIAGRAVRAGQIAWSDPVATDDRASTLDLRAPDGDAQTTVLLFAGQPIGEPVVAGGPFVMNTEAEIRQAFQDFRAGRFGQVPRQARLLTR